MGSAKLKFRAGKDGGDLPVFRILAGLADHHLAVADPGIPQRLALDAQAEEAVPG